MIVKKSPEEIEEMAAGGRIHARCMNMLRGKARAGVTTGDLDEAAARFLDSQGAEASFLGYRGFPGSICASPNSMIVHGIPGPYELKRGDVLAIDLGVTYNGWVLDAAVTVPIGPVSPVATKLLAATRDSLFDAVEQCRVGNHIGDIGFAVQNRVEPEGFAVVRSLVGHGVGRSMHEDPQVPNYGRPGGGRRAHRGDGHRRRAHGHRREPGDPDGRGRLGGVLGRWLAFGPFRAHGGHHGRRPADPHALASRGIGAPSGLIGPYHVQPTDPACA